jgi:homoserine kinase
MIEIKIPATSANMGPGFDCLGIALNLYNHFYIEETDGALEIDCGDEAFNNSDNLIYTSMEYTYEKLNLGKLPRGLRIKCTASIPVSRGLGSSAACILGGVIGASELAGGVLSKDEILNIATEIEGHPDNLAPALFGGMIVSIMDNDRVYYERINIPQGVKFCVMIPDFKLSTKEARAVLPSSINFKDSVFNVGRVALMLAALTNGNWDLLRVACEDKLHQPYRGRLIKGYDEIISQVKNQDYMAVFISGAGPSIMAILRENDNSFMDNISNYFKNNNLPWSLKELKPEPSGSVIANRR